MNRREFLKRITSGVAAVVVPIRVEPPAPPASQESVSSEMEILFGENPIEVALIRDEASVQGFYSMIWFSSKTGKWTERLTHYTDAEYYTIWNTLSKNGYSMIPQWPRDIPRGHVINRFYRPIPIAGE